MSTDNPKELKFHPQSVGKTHMAWCATTKDTAEQKIQSEWKQGGYDIAKSLRDLEMIPIEDNRPERALSKLQVDKGNEGRRTEWHGHLLPGGTPSIPRQSPNPKGWGEPSLLLDILYLLQQVDAR